MGKSFNLLKGVQLLIRSLFFNPFLERKNDEYCQTIQRTTSRRENGLHEQSKTSPARVHVEETWFIVSFVWFYSLEFR